MSIMHFHNVIEKDYSSCQSQKIPVYMVVIVLIGLISEYCCPSKWRYVFEWRQCDSVNELVYYVDSHLDLLSRLD